VTRSLHGPIACLVAGLLACSPGGDDAPAPSLTAQGFPIAQAQASTLGDFGDLELRVQAPAGIESLRIVERSYEVDLASSPEPAHFPLFGLERRVWSRGDVTLNFRGYIDQKLTEAGEYAFQIRVVDRRSREASATLRVVVQPAGEPAVDEATTPAVEAEPPPQRPSAAAVETGVFRLQRIGAGPVLGGDAFGLTWKTIEAHSVVIRLTRSDGGARGLARIQDSDYEAVDTGDELERIVRAIGLQASLDLTTANDAAAGAVLAVAHRDGGYLLQTDRSETSLSELGTTVTLHGRFKH